MAEELKETPNQRDALLCAAEDLLHSITRSRPASDGSTIILSGPSAETIKALEEIVKKVRGKW